MSLKKSSIGNHNSQLLLCDGGVLFPPLQKCMTIWYTVRKQANKRINGPITKDVRTSCVPTKMKKEKD